MTLNLPTLRIDCRSGNVEMLHGLDVWTGVLPLSAGDRTKLSTAQLEVTLRPSSELEQRNSDSSPDGDPT